MLVLKQWWRHARRRVGGWPRVTEVHLDVGSHTTKLSVGGPYVKMLPTAFIRDQRTGQLTTIGERVEKLVGKLPPSFTVVRPVRRGVVVDSEGYFQFLQALLQDDLPSFPFNLWRPLQLSTHQLHPSQVSQTALLQQLGHRLGVSCRVEPTATVLWRAVHHQKIFTTHGCVIDLGAMTTKLYLYAEEQLVAAHVLELGGDWWTEQVIAALRQEAQLEVGWQTAEQLKMVAVRYASKEQKHTVQGKDVISGLPVTRVVNERIFGPGANQLAQQLLTGFAELCRSASPDLVARILEQGIYLTGGSSQLVGLRQLLQDRLKLPVQLGQYPQHEVMKGL